MKKFNEINFNTILKLQEYESYDYDVYLSQDCSHKICGFCTNCESKGINESVEPGFKLNHISHGSHSLSFLRSMNLNFFENGIDSPILFLLESPSIDYNMYFPITYEEITKSPSRKWYWVGPPKESVTYPDYWKLQQYDNLFKSIITTFKLNNLYITNLIKCGLNNDLGQFRGIDSYKEETISNCFDIILEKEIEIHNPKVIFVFGSKTYSKFIQNYRGDKLVVKMTHPASRGITSEDFRILTFWKFLKSIFDKNIIDDRTYDKFIQIIK